METLQDELKEVAVDRITVNPHQPRRHFSESDLEELSLSIKELGLIHPPLVRPLDKGDRYEIVSGERRFRAAQLAGLTSIKVIVRKSSESISAQQALVENIQRVDLNPMEVAEALKSLIEEFGFAQEDLAQRVGKNRSTVANYLRLLSLPKVIQQSLTRGEISMGHAKVVLSLKDFEKQMLLYETIIRDALSVREAEKAALRIEQKAKKKKLIHENRDFFLDQLSEKIQQRLGTKVSIMGKGKRGRISIDYYNLDDLDRLLAVFGVEGL